MGTGEVIWLLKPLFENRSLGLFRVVSNIIHRVYHPCCQVSWQLVVGECHRRFRSFPCGSADKESACNTRDLGLTRGLGRSPGEGKGYPLQYYDLENSMHGLYSPWGPRIGHDWATMTFLAGQLPLLVVGRMSQRFQGDTLWREAFSEVTFSALKAPSLFFVLSGLCCSTCGSMLPSGGDRGELQMHRGFWALAVAQGNLVDLSLCLLTLVWRSASGTQGDFVPADTGFQ